MAIRIPGTGPRLLIASDEAGAAALAHALGDRACHLPDPSVLPLDERAPDPATLARRLCAIASVEAGNVEILVASPEAAIAAVPCADAVGLSLTLRTGEAFDPAAVEGELRDLGYERTGRVDAPTRFALSPGALDVWPGCADAPLRVRLDGERIAAIATFDADTQRSGADEIDAATITTATPMPGHPDEPAADWPLHAGRRTLSDLLPETVVQPGAVERGMALIAEIDAEEEALREAGERVPPRRAWLTAEEWAALTKDARTTGARDDLAPPPRVPDRDAFPSELLSEGDRVVHLHHGIAAYEGLRRVEIDGEGADVLALRFADGGLDVPASHADLVWRYGSREEDAPLDRLRGGDWTAGMAEIAREMVEQADAMAEALKARADRVAPALGWDDDVLASIAAEGPVPTPAQEQALRDLVGDTGAEAKGDRRGIRPPMDRLLCGDTGCGKTEVILRAAAATVLAERQAVVVAPTTLLARQHGDVFTARLAPHGIRVEVLTGATPAAERDETEAALAAGEPMVVVGTTLLAGEAEFGAPGLLVLDEEQRFGAADKLALRAKAPDAHVLATTATPIPRTLDAALAGLRDVTTMRSAPPGRRGVRTFVAEWDAARLGRALRRERAAGGRSFVVVPRIAAIDAVRDGLAALDPELRVATLHGRMEEDEVERTMATFRAGEADVLLATTVIETGLDVPDANLIVVLDAGRLGLGQLHQLRGRVGRGRRRGRALLFAACPWIDAEPAEGTSERLALLEHHDGPGSGFAIAAHDLDQRGSGELFGEAQSGHARRIGLELQGAMLLQARRGAQGAMLALGSARIERPGAGLPESYVPDPDIRARLYGRIAKAIDAATLDDVREEVADRFGPLPAAAAALFETAAAMLRWRAVGALDISIGPKAVAVDMPTEGLGALPAGAVVKPSRIVLPLDDGADADEALDALLHALEGGGELRDVA